MNQELKENIVVPSGGVSSWRARQRCGMLDDVFVAVSIEQRRGGVRRICAGWTGHGLDYLTTHAHAHACAAVPGLYTGLCKIANDMLIERCSLAALIGRRLIVSLEYQNIW